MICTLRLLAPKTGQLLRAAPARLAPSTTTIGGVNAVVALLAATSVPSISAVCTYIHQHEGAAGVRRMLGAWAFSAKGPAVVDEAAKRRSTSACRCTAFSVGISTLLVAGAAEPPPGRPLIRQPPSTTISSIAKQEHPL